MLDIYFRPLKDRVFNPICGSMPDSLTPLSVTALAFMSGLSACVCAATDRARAAVVFWLVNRALDCLDGALARHRGQASDLGGFLDLLGDFVVYSLVPIGCAVSTEAERGPVWRLWLAVASVEASFHVNHFVLFYVAAVLEKRKAMEAGAGEGKTGTKELTSVMMRPALVEGMESGIMFTVMLARPAWTEALCWTMTVLVGVGICQRVWWLVPVMS